MSAGAFLLGTLLLVPPQAGPPGQARRSSELATRPLFADLHELLPERFAPAAAALGDVDGDGDVDAFFADGFDLIGIVTPELWVNSGAGRMRSGPDLGPWVPFTSLADLADLDGDLDLDVLLGDELYVGDGAGSFARDPTSQPDGLRGRARALADLDGDGDLDTVASAYELSDWRDFLFLNDGTGRFTDASVNLPAGADGSWTLASGDVDADGDADVLSSGYDCSPYPCTRVHHLYVNDGSAGFSDASANLPPAAGGWGLSLADVDGDLDLDALGFGGLYLNDGAGVFADASAQLPSTSGTGGLALDVDADGDVDLAGGSVLWLGDGAGVFVAGPALPGDPSGSLYAADLDGDGDVDLLRTKPYVWNGLREIPGSTDFLLNDGGGAFLSFRPFALELPGEHGNGVLADMDGDGDLDAVTGVPKDLQYGSYEQKTFLGWNDGHGRFTDSTGSMPWITTLPRALVAADIDGDGDQDLLIGGSENDDGDGGGLDRMFQVSGAFTHPDLWFSHLWLGGSTTDIAAGDVDGDGDLDVLHGNDWSVTFPDGLVLNDGSGSYAEQPSPAVFLDVRDVELLDIDDDGDLDALFSGALGAALYRNDGGSWSDVSGQLSFTRGERLSQGDVELDGDTDLLVGDRTSARLHENQAGVFTAGKVLVTRSPASFSVAVLLDDFDADGDLDALTGAADTVFENDGGGRFAAGPWTAAALPDRTALGDVDQDGDHDRLAQGRLASSLVRQVAWRAPPQLGRTLTIELCGAGGEPWTLYSSPNTGRFVVGSQGTLLLGPPLTVAATGAFDHHGRAGFSTLVPNQVALIGSSLFWQALAGTPARFTNRETTTITGH
jgi:hypothetical protein